MKRRDFLAGAAVTGFGFGMGSILSDLVQSFVLSSLDRTSKGSTFSEEPRSYVQWNLFGAPARWAFDHILKPTKESKFLQCHGVYNRFKNIDLNNPHLITGEYGVTERAGFLVPHLWGSDVITSKGRMPLSSLLDNMLMVRGCNIVTNGHPLPSYQQLKISSESTSLMDTYRKKSKKLFGVVCVGGAPINRAFLESQTSYTRIPDNEKNYLSYMFESLIEVGDLSNNLNKITPEVVDLARTFYKSLKTANPSLKDNEYSGSMEKMLKTSIQNFCDQFPSLEQKYRRIFLESNSLNPIEGVTDRRIPGLKFPMQIEGRLIEQNQLSSHLHAHHYKGEYLCNNDIRSIFENTICSYLPKQFALAEFLLKNQISNFLVLSPPGIHEEDTYTLDNLNVWEFYRQTDLSLSHDNGNTIIQSNLPPMENLNRWIPHDSHGVGWIANVLACNRFYRGFGACLLEIREQLKEVRYGSESLFENTIMHIASEFDRRPLGNAEETSHLPNAHVTSFLSGAIKKTQLIGNIFAESPYEYRHLPRETMGIGAPISELGGEIRIQHIHSTIQKMLRIDNTHKEFPSLVEEHAGAINSALPRGENV